MMKPTLLLSLAAALAGGVSLLPASAAVPQSAPHKAASPKAAAKRPAAAPVVRMVTARGTILIKLFPKAAPLSVANFEKLVNKGFYNGLTFHRITDLQPGTPSKIVQGGDPDGTGEGGPGYTIKGEFPKNGVQNPLTHNAGAVAMARSGEPDSAGSQFYICVNPVHFLDGSYAVFGQVIKGLDVANKLQIGDKMTKVTLVK